MTRSFSFSPAFLPFPLSSIFTPPPQHSLNQTSIKCATPIHFAWGLPEKHPGRCYSKIPQTAQGQNNKTLLHNSATTTAAVKKARKIWGEREKGRPWKEKRSPKRSLMVMVVFLSPCFDPSPPHVFQTFKRCLSVTNLWPRGRHHHPGTTEDAFSLHRFYFTCKNRILRTDQCRDLTREAGVNNPETLYHNFYDIHTPCMPNPHLGGIAASAWTKRLHTCRHAREGGRRRRKDWSVCVWITDFMQRGGFTHTHTF